jgi:hypothetical protein
MDATPLACWKGAPFEVIKLLLDKGAEVNALIEVSALQEIPSFIVY